MQTEIWILTTTMDSSLHLSPGASARYFLALRQLAYTDAFSLVLNFKSQMWLKDKGFLPWYLLRILVVPYFAKVECANMHAHNRSSMQFYRP